MISYVLAVVAAGANAASSVLQRAANRQVPRAENLSWRLIWSLLHQPLWFGGVLAITVGFLLQASALGAGELAVVEPVLVLELPLTLIGASLIFRQRMGWREWASAMALAAGLAGLLATLAPSAGRSSGVRWYVWVAGTGLTLAVVAGLTAWARRGPAGALRAALLAIAAGTTFGRLRYPP